MGLTTLGQGLIDPGCLQVEKVSKSGVKQVSKNNQGGADSFTLYGKSPSGKINIATVLYKYL